MSGSGGELPIGWERWGRDVAVAAVVVAAIDVAVAVAPAATAADRSSYSFWAISSCAFKDVTFAWLSAKASICDSGCV